MHLYLYIYEYTYSSPRQQPKAIAHSSSSHSQSFLCHGGTKPERLTLQQAVPALTFGFQIHTSDNGGPCKGRNSGDSRDSISDGQCQHSGTALALPVWTCATHCNTPQNTATHCNTLQRTATHCNTLQFLSQHVPDTLCQHYWVDTISRLLKIKGLFCRI